MRGVEQVSWDEELGVYDLARATYANKEPGFQINGVVNIDQLKFILDSLTLATPIEYRDQHAFNHAEPGIDTPSARAAIWPEAGRDSEAHVDSGFTGLAVHHNISHVVPIMMGVVKVEPPSDYHVFPQIEKKHMTKLREGETIPGRLTIFSEGHSPWLKKTVHFFDRRGTEGPIQWARYSHTIFTDFPVSTVRSVALRAFEQLKHTASDI